jgi:AcrR family transcriptional regulator
MPESIDISKGERTRQAIIDAAHDVFIEKGYHAASMRQIAKQAGIAVGGIYNHFASKEDIFSAIVLKFHPYKRILPIALAAGGEDIETFAHNTGQAIANELRTNPDFVNLIFIEIVEFQGKHMAQIFQDVYPQVLPLLERFQSENARDIPPMMLMRIFIGTFIAYYLTEISFSAALMPTMEGEAMHYFIDVFLHGVLEKESE